MNRATLLKPLIKGDNPNMRKERFIKINSVKELRNHYFYDMMGGGGSLGNHHIKKNTKIK